MSVRLGFEVGRTMTGGSSAVRTRDSTGWSMPSSPSTLCAVRFEFDRNRLLTWL